MSDIIQIDRKKKCLFIGNKYFFCSGKCSINPRPYNFILTTTSFIYNFIHSFYYMNKFLNGNKIINIILTLLFTFQIILALLTFLIDPGSLIPNKSGSEDESKKKTGNATIKGEKYELEFCYDCHIMEDYRTLHCDECGLCAIRYDHHCPWLSTCIGLNNHKYFLFFILTNAVFFGFTTSLYIYCALHITELNLEIIDYIFAPALMIMNLGLFAFNIILNYFHTLYLCTGQTTREKKRAKRLNQTVNPFELTSCFDNVKEFFFYPMRYRNRMIFDTLASKYIDTNPLIIDYIRGNYIVTKDNKKISKTLIDKGLNYSPKLIEMSNIINESDKETEPSYNIDDVSENIINERLASSEGIV